MHSILEQRRSSVAALKRVRPLSYYESLIADLSPILGFKNAIEEKVAQKKPAVIAEIKKASPSKGVLRPDYRPVNIAKDYEKHEAACLSVLTEPYFFQGNDQHLIDVKSQVSLPVLRKDFIVDPYQVYESRCLGADCILLIVSALSDQELMELCELASSLGLDILVECHTLDELRRALLLPSHVLIGVNNRNLNTFEVDIGLSVTLKQRMPEDRILISESGIKTVGDVLRLDAAGIHAFLVGEAFMVAASPGKEVSQLFKTK